MSKRSERREADRLARKLAFKQRNQLPAQVPAESAAPADNAAAPADNTAAHADSHSENAADLLAHAQAFFALKAEPEGTPDPEPAPKKPVSEAQLNANRANAQHSTGATSAEGKAKSSMNALKHGLTGKMILLPLEDAAAYRQSLETFMEFEKPATEEECALVQSIVDCRWRIDRICRLQTSILLKGHDDCAKTYEDRKPLERARLMEAEAYLKYKKQIRNLYLQEARLHRLMEKDRKELARLKAERRLQEQAEMQAQPKAEKAAPAKNGFDFSTSKNQQPQRPPMPPNDHRTAAETGGLS